MPVLKQSSLKNKPPEVTIVRPPEKDLLVWKAVSRPFKKRNKEYFTTIAAVVFLLVVILFFLKEWLLIGVIIGDKPYFWPQLTHFWFSKKWDSQILNLETTLAFPRRLQIVLGELSREKVKKVLDKYLTLEKPKMGFVDKAADWLVKKFPLEK